MFRLWIVTSSLFVASFCEDVNFSFSETCFSQNDNLKLTAVYTGSGTVTAVQWYYSNKTGSNLFVVASTCSIAGGLVPEGYPDESRMTLGCDVATKTFTLTLDGLLDEELDKSWGATFSLSGDPSPDVKPEPLSVCSSCTCECKCKCKKMVIASIVIGIAGAIILPIVVGGTVKEYFGRKTALGVDSIGILCGVTSFVLGIVVQVEDCCKASDCCEDSDCCKDECERNWIENIAAVFIVIGGLVGIAGGVIFYRVWSGRIGRGNNGITKQDLRPLEEIVCEKLLRVLESVYPNILSVKDLIRIDFAEESVVMEQLEELRRKDLIRQLDSGGFVRHFLDVKTAYKAEEAKEPGENDRMMETSN